VRVLSKDFLVTPLTTGKVGIAAPVESSTTFPMFQVYEGDVTDDYDAFALSQG